MKKLFLPAILVITLVFASGCTQQPAGNNPLPASGSDRNFFQRPCNTDADCNMQQRQGAPPGDWNSPRDFNAPPRDFNAPRDFNSGRWQGNNDTNRQRIAPEFKCVSGYCKPVPGGNNETG